MERPVKFLASLSADSVTDMELIKQFQEVEKLNSDEKHLVKTFLVAFITKKKIQQLAQ